MSKRFIFTSFLAFLSLFLIFMLYNSIYYTQNVAFSQSTMKVFDKPDECKPQKNQSYEKDKVTCAFPKMDPFDEKILKYANKPENLQLKCDKFETIIFSMSLNGTLKQEKNPDHFGYSNCCYRVLTRKNEMETLFSPKCTKIESIETMIKDEYISVYCENKNKTINIDYFSTINLEAFRSKNPKKNTNSLKDSYNVLVFGLDSFSNMNFQRTLASSFTYLKENLNIFTFKGFNKVGEGTFPNVIPMLTGNHFSDLKNFCLPTLRNSYFDACTYIWDEFSAQDFVTFYTEEDPALSAFNLVKKGFKKQPTDYYYRIFALGMYKNVLNSKFCYGPRLSFEILLDYMKKTAFAFRNQKDEKYFQFLWQSILTHPDMNNAYYADQSILEFLKWFNVNGYLSETILFIVSDHGMRWGAIRQTRQGKFEERLPFFSIVFPQAFREKYSSAMKFMKLNEERLITHFDIHETLKDLTNLKNVENKKIDQRLASFKRARGISLFLPIPLDRNCSEAGIHSHWCVCEPVATIPVTCSDAIKSAQVLVQALNKMLAKSPQCEALVLESILEGVEKFSFPNYNVDGDTIKEEIEEIRIGISTLPGSSTFEATIQNKNGKFSILGGTEEISRTNVYGDQSWCVDDKELKKICYCKIQHKGK